LTFERLMPEAAGVIEGAVIEARLAPPPTAAALEGAVTAPDSIGMAARHSQSLEA
jgi:hypothetical protein